MRDFPDFPGRAKDVGPEIAAMLNHYAVKVWPDTRFQWTDEHGMIMHLPQKEVMRTMSGGLLARHRFNLIMPEEMLEHRGCTLQRAIGVLLGLSPPGSTKSWLQIINGRPSPAKERPRPTPKQSLHPFAGIW